MSVQDIADQVPVLRVVRFEPGNKRSGGSALRLSDRSILLTDHQIRDDESGKLFDNGWIIIESALHQYTLKAGGGGRRQKDWAVLELDPPLAPSSPTIATDFSKRLEPGTEVFVVAYFFFPNPLEMSLTLEELFTFPRLALRGMVTPRPNMSGLPLDAVYIDTPARLSLFGASGGAVVVKDSQTGQLTAVGTLSTGLQRKLGEYAGVMLSRPEGALGAAGEKEGSEPK